MKEENKLRTKEEIKEYLFLPNDCEISRQLLDDAIEVEKKYAKELDEGIYGYAVECDFNCTPFILEDEDVVEGLRAIDKIGDVVVYEIIFSEESEDTE